MTNKIRFYINSSHSGGVTLIKAITSQTSDLRCKKEARRRYEEAVENTVL